MRTAIIALVLSLAAAAWAQEVDFGKYVREKADAAPVAPEAQKLASELAAEVQKMLDAGPVGSARFVVGIGGASVCYANSGETLFALAEALPLVPAEMQPKLKAHMKALLEAHAPWTPAYLIQPGEGAWPMYAPKPPAAASLEPGAVPACNAYFAWKYADATGDWAAVEKGYDAIHAILGPQAAGQAMPYPRVAGAIGLARIARHLGRDADARGAEELATFGLKAGADYEKLFDAAYAKQVSGSHDWSYPPFTERRKGAVITVFAPEVLRMLRENALPAVKKHADPVMDRWDRTWFLTRPSLPTFYGQYYFKGGAQEAPNFMKRAWGKSGQGDFGQENSILTPEVACTLFLIRAYVYGEQAPQLTRYLDVPWVPVGDVYHIQKLVAAIRAHGGVKWTAVR